MMFMAERIRRFVIVRHNYCASVNSYLHGETTCEALSDYQPSAHIASDCTKTAVKRPAARKATSLAISIVRMMRSACDCRLLSHGKPPLGNGGTPSPTASPVVI